jgi:uncharacterized protein (UPF0335 family)
MLVNLGTKVEPFLKRIETLRADRDTERGESMARCRAIADDIKNVYGDAEAAGIEPKALKALVKRRALEGQITGLPAEFDEEEARQYETLATQFAGTPLGEWASRAEPDWQERPDEADLAKIGRGRGRRKDTDALADAH